MTSPCPNCGKQSKCGCESCVKRNGFDEETETFDETGNLIICPFCKVASHPDHWLDSEMKEIQNKFRILEDKQSRRFPIDKILFDKGNGELSMSSNTLKEIERIAKTCKDI